MKEYKQKKQDQTNTESLLPVRWIHTTTSTGLDNITSPPLAACMQQYVWWEYFDDEQCKRNLLLRYIRMLRTTRTAPSDSKISVLIGRKHATDDRNLLFRQGSPSPVET